jgi:hypothetical protein
VHMEPSESRHQCLIYEGESSHHLPTLVGVVREKLRYNYRCLFLDCAPMVVGMRLALGAGGVNVMSEVAAGRLVMTSERNYLIRGRRFEIEPMMQGLARALQDALDSGFEGLWASGNIGWELGPERNFSQLLEYEWKLEDFVRDNPRMSGICQYHRDTLPREALIDGVLSHSRVFVDPTRSLANPHAADRQTYRKESRENPTLEEFVQHICVLTA